MNLLQLFFPSSCVSCNKIGSYLCQNCISKISQTDLVCPMCERLSLGGMTHPICQRRYGLDGLWSLGVYQDPLRKVIQKLKYRWIKECANVLIQILINYWIYHPPLLLDLIKKDQSVDWIITPVPLHKMRQNKRGFNQSELLAKELAQKLGIPYKDLLIRTRNTHPQVGFTSAQRKENIKGAFNCLEFSMKDKKIIIVDDVWTTGSTLKECGYVLKRNGAQIVWALTLAR